ncbi:hypothetical protein GC174_07400 [bacterium]|nr:hypothetical protein [bacterium]
MKRRLAATLVISLILPMVSPLPASALDFQKMMKDYVDKNVLKKGGGGAQAATLNNLAVQQSRLENDIQAGIQSGKLTTTEATELTNELNAIKQSATQAMADGTLHDPEVVSMVQAMEALGTKIQNYTNNTSTTTPGSATVPASTSVATPAATPVTTPAATSIAPGTPPVPIAGNVLYQRIANGLAAGRINRTQANDLFKMENRIHDLESQLRSQSGSNFDRHRIMYNELEQLSRSIDTTLGGK